VLVDSNEPTIIAYTGKRTSTSAPAAASVHSHLRARDLPTRVTGPPPSYGPASHD
jgi:hypothetical protein